MMTRPSSLFTLLLFHISVFTLALENHDGRDIVSPLLSAVDSLFGVSTAESTEPPTATFQTTAITATPASQTAASPVAVSTSTIEQAPTDQLTSLAALTGSKIGISTTVTVQPSVTIETPSAIASSGISQPPQTPTTNSVAAVPSNPLNNLPSSTQAAPQATSASGNSISTAGIAIAIVFAVVIIAGIAYLVLKFNPAVNSRYSKWQESRQKKRSYRVGLDDDEEIGQVVGSYNGFRGRGLDASARTPPWRSDESPRQEQSKDKNTGMNMRPRSRTSRPLSFQFFSQSSPKREAARQTTSQVRRKPVPMGEYNICYYENACVAYGGSWIGVAMPLSQNNKELPAVPR